MKEDILRAILGRMGIQAERRNRRGWLEFKCPLAPYLHRNGFDTRPSAAAKVNDTGPSSFVCKACHAHGRVSKLINMLAGFRQDNSIRPLMLEADRADAQAISEAPYPDFERTYEADAIPPALDVGMYEGVYTSVTQVPEAMAYLAGRNINAETANKLFLHYDDRQRRILFPVYTRDGSFYGFTGRAIDDGVHPKVRDYFGLPKYHLILGEHLWKRGRPLILIEGLIGYAHLTQLDVDANLGAIMGSAMTPAKVQRIINLDERTFLLLDNDDGGDIGLFGTPTPDGSREANGAIALLTGHVPLYIPEWPDGKGDPDQLTREEVDAILAHTPLYTESGEGFDKPWGTWV